MIRVEFNTGPRLKNLPRHFLHAVDIVSWHAIEKFREIYGGPKEGQFIMDSTPNAGEKQGEHLSIIHWLEGKNDFPSFKWQLSWQIPADAVGQMTEDFLKNPEIISRYDEYELIE